MSIPAIKHYLHLHLSKQNGLFLLGLVGFGLIVSLLIYFYYPHSSGYIAVAGSTVLLALSGLVFDIFETTRNGRYLDYLARHTGLSYIAGSSLLGTSSRLSGTYRGRSVTLQHHGQGKSLVPSTRIELAIENVANTSLRLRGPIASEHPQHIDQITSDMISASGLQKIGTNRQFLIGGDSIHVKTRLLSVKSLQEKLFNLSQPINIEIKQQKLFFEQLGITYDANQLCFLLDLLNELVDIIERGGTARLMMHSAALRI